LGQGKQGYVETFRFVIAEELGCEKAAVFWLRIPIELQANWREAVVCSGLIAVAAGDGEREGEQDKECGMR
jgi:hypothetical protein